MKRVTSRHNAALQHVRKLQASRSYRYACGQFVADGTKLFAEALQWLPGLELVVAADNVPLPPLPAGLEELRVPADVMQWISQMQAPQGVLFVGRLPEPRPLSLTPGCLILDGLQDPGNLGTILRTADALEVPVVLLDGCADAYNPKTVRATMGAVFRTQPVRMTRAEAVQSCRAAGIPLLATAMSADAVDLRKKNLSGCAVVIGSEGRGVSAELFAAADGKIIIPMNPRCESLNAAAAATIVLWQMKC